MSVATANLCASAASHRFELVIVDTADRRGLGNVGRLDFRNVWLALRHTAEFVYRLLSRRPDIVYVPIAQNMLGFIRDCGFLLPARFLRVPTVIHLHGGYFKRFYATSPPHFRWLVRLALGRASCAIVLGEAFRDHFDGILPNGVVRVIPNGIDDFAGAVEPPSAERIERVVVFLSTLMATKGVFALLEAVPKVLAECDAVRFVFAGEWVSPEEEAAAMRFVAETGCTEQVEFRPPVGPNDKHDLLRGADVFAFPTKYPLEGHPYVIIEAMCAGLPIVTTDTGCIVETVENGANGFIVGADDTTALASRILALLRDDELRERMGACSREKYLNYYTLERWGRDICEALGSVLQRD